MMKAIIKIFIPILILASLSNCENIYMDKKYPVYLKNNTEHSIGAYFALGGEFGTLYPDTALPETNQYVIKEIKPGARYIKDSGVEWEKIYSELPKDTMSVYIFHTDTLNKYSWKKVRDDYMILNRYDLSLENLERLDFAITYP